MKKDTDRKQLKTIAAHVIRLLGEDGRAKSVRPRAISRLKAVVSEADGWCYEIGWIRGVRRGTFQLWLDRWPGSRFRVLSYCYAGRNVEVVRPAVIASAKKLGITIKRKGAVRYAKDGRPQMPVKLKSSEFEKPVFETYSKHDCYYGVFLKRSGKILNVPRAAHLAERFFSTVASSVTANRAPHALTEEPYPAVENRRLVGLHLRWERSKRLANEAKRRDGYHCAICGINFEHSFGAKFSRISEAHHIIPLAFLNRRRRTTVDDLITVCPSCHRMLHRMNGHAKDVPNLQRILRISQTMPQKRV